MNDEIDYFTQTKHFSQDSSNKLMTSRDFSNKDNNSTFVLTHKSNSKLPRKNYILKQDFFNIQLDKKNIHNTSSDNSLFTPKNKQSRANLIVSYYGVHTETAQKNKEPLQENFILNKMNAEQSSIIMVIQSNIGCRYFQTQITRQPSFGNDILYPQLKQSMLLLINDQFGNYLYQQFLDILNKDNFEHFKLFVIENFTLISTSPHGTRVIQKLLDIIDFNSEEGMNFSHSISEIIKGKVKELSMDEHANHIIQKYFTYLKYPDNIFIFEEIERSFLQIARTKSGCCVVQTCLINGHLNQKQKLILLTFQNINSLITDQFGNYVCQCLISLNEDWIISKIFQIISNQLISLCKEKYSSNVIEKFFEIKNKKFANDIAKLVLKNNSEILELICNDYGNYIIQRIMITVPNKSLTIKILEVIGKNIHIILKLSYGKKLLFRLQKIYPFLSTMCLY